MRSTKAGDEAIKKSESILSYLEKLKAKKQQQYESRSDHWKMSYNASLARETISDIDKVKDKALVLVRELYSLYPD